MKKHALQAKGRKLFRLKMRLDSLKKDLDESKMALLPYITENVKIQGFGVLRLRPTFLRNQFSQDKLFKYLKEINLSNEQINAAKKAALIPKKVEGYICLVPGKK